jgi:hypothetical protein
VNAGSDELIGSDRNIFGLYSAFFTYLDKNLMFPSSTFYAATGSIACVTYERTVRDVPQLGRWFQCGLNESSGFHVTGIEAGTRDMAIAKATMQQAANPRETKPKVATQTKPNSVLIPKDRGEAKTVIRQAMVLSSERLPDPRDP